MAFSDQSELNGQGVAFKLDISLDGFSSIAYRYSSVAGIDSSNEYDPRLIGVGRLERRLGEGNRFQTSSVSIVISNEDEVADWLVDRANASDVLKARCRLYIGLYYKELPNLPAWKQLGEFVFGEMPRRTVDRITAVLNDATLGAVEHMTPIPTTRDLAISIGYAGTKYGQVDPSAIPEVPHQLAFGDDWVPLDLTYPSIGGTVGTSYAIFPVCVTTSTAAVTANDITKVFAAVNFDVASSQPSWSLPRVTGEIPSTWISRATGASATVWEAVKSADISKGGKTWKVLYLKLYTEPFISYILDKKNISGTASSGNVIDVIQALWVKGFPLSSRTNTTTAKLHPADLIRDLVTYYSLGSSSFADTTSLDRIKSAYTAGGGAAGVIRPDMGGSTPPLRHVIEEIASSFDLDPYVTWTGTVGLTGRLLDYTQATGQASLRTIDETRIEGLEEALPAPEQRGSPFNRITVYGAREDGVLRFIGLTPPVSYDDPSDTVTSWSRVLTREVNVLWRTEADAVENPWSNRNVDNTFRPGVRFTTDLSAINLELGDYFKLNWTRNLGDPYTDAIFQVMGLGLNPETMTVEVEAMWTDELASEQPYLLDDETILRRVAASGGRTCTVTNADSNVSFSSGSLITDGVQVGDHLIIRDATESATAFLRNKVLEIISIVDATNLRVDDPVGALAFGSPGGTAVADWEIRRSHITYPTLASDAANYPDGGNMYGRVSSADSAGVFSAAGTGGFTAGHKLLDG
jgi:hypothetical protein